MLKLLKLSFTIWVFASSCLAGIDLVTFNERDMQPYLFDNNCLPFAKSKRFVRGHPQFLNQLDKRTERWFAWEKITESYKGYVENPQISEVAIERYKSYDPLNPPESLLTCRDSQGALEGCLAFNAYCTEQIATRGIKEELVEWRDRVQNCKNPRYLADFPEHCSRDFIKSLNYLAHHARNISHINKSKSPAVAMYFKEAEKTFGEFANELDKLVGAKEDAIAAANLKKEEDKKREVTADTLKKCKDLVDKEEKDVKNRNIAGNILGGMSENALHCTVDTIYTNQVRSDLETELKKVRKFSAAAEIAPKLNTIAIKKSAKAMWSTFETFFNKSEVPFDVQNRQGAIDLICDQKRTYPHVKTQVDISKLCSPDFKQVLNEAYDEYLKVKEHYPVKAVSQKELEEEALQSFNPAIDSINKACKEAKKKYDKAQLTYSCVDLARTAKMSRLFNKAKQAQKDSSTTGTTTTTKKLGFPTLEELPRDLKYLHTNGMPMGVNKCDQILELKYKHLRSIESKAYSVANPVYNELVQSRLGHLMITDKFQAKVGLASKDWVYNRCFKGSGKAFGKVSMPDVNKGLKDFFDLNFQELYDVAYEKATPGSNYLNIKEYLKNNPLTIAELLEKNPDEDYALALCTFIRDINSIDYRRRWAERGAIAVGVVAGVALSITGVGAPAGAALIGLVGAATTTELAIINAELKEEKSDVEELKKAGVTFQTDLQDAITTINSKRENIKGLEKNRKLVVVLGALDVLGAGGFRLMKNFLKTRRGLSAGKFLGVTAQQLSQASAVKIAKKLSMSIESILSRSKGELKKFFKALDHEEMMEFAALYSKLDPKAQKELIAKLSKLNNKAELRLFIHSLDDHMGTLLANGKLNFGALDNIINEVTSLKLADGTVIDGLVEGEKIVGNVASVGTDVTLANKSAIHSKSFLDKKLNKYLKQLEKQEELSKFVDNLPLEAAEKNNFLTHLSFADPIMGKRLMSVMSDSAKVQEEFWSALKKTGCLGKVYDSKCGKIVRESFDKLKEVPLSEHKLYKDWLLKQSQDIQKVFSSADLTGADLYLASKSLSHVGEVKNIERAKEFVDFLTTVSEKNRIAGFKDIDLVLSGKALPNNKVFRKFKSRTRIFNGYEKYFYEKTKLLSQARLKKIAKERGIEPTKTNLDELAKEEAKRLKGRFMKKFNSCKAGNAKGVQAANLKRFLKFNTASSLGFTIASYMWIMGSDDESEVVVNEDGSIKEGKPDKDYTSLISVLGYELVASYVFSKVPGIVLKGSKGTLGADALVDYSANGALDYVNTRIFGAIFGIDESESKKKIEEMLTDPTKKAALDQLKKYVDNKMGQPHMQKIVKDLESEFSLFEGGLEAEDEYNYDYLMDNFSSEELVSSDDLVTAFEESLNEFKYDRSAGELSMSKYVKNLTGMGEVSLENDLFYYNSVYNVPSAIKRVFMYNLISNRLCMGRWGEVLAFTAVDKFISNAAYWGGRKLFVGDTENLDAEIEGVTGD